MWGRGPDAREPVVEAWLPVIGSETFCDGPMGSPRFYRELEAVFALQIGCECCDCDPLLRGDLTVCELGRRAGRGGWRDPVVKVRMGCW